MKIRRYSIAKMIAALAAAIVPLFVRAASDELASGLDSLGWSSKITITANPTEALKDFPMLIKINKDSPVGFDYKYAKADGSDIRFIYRDKDGNLALDVNGLPKILEHEIDTWDPSGESVIWVKVPQYENGASVTMYWGELVDKKAPDAKDSKSVWSDYVAVWHMDDAEDAKNGGKGRLGSNTQQYTGILGKAYGNKSNAGGAILAATNTESTVAMNTLNGNTNPGDGEDRPHHSKTFTASFWVYLNGNSSADAVLIARLNGINTTQANNGYGADNGWGFSFRTANNYTNIRYWFKDGDGFSSGAMTKAVAQKGWHRMDIILDDWYNHNDGDTGYSSVWLDGVKVNTCDVESTFAAVDAVNRPFQIGGLAVPTVKNGVITGFSDSKPLNGRIDEMRVRQGTLPEAWIKADYDQVTNTRYEFEEAVATPGATLKNRWVIEPSISKTMWVVGDEVATVTKGEALYGESYFIFTSTTSITNNVPSEAGIYTYIAQTDGREPGANGFNWGWEPLYWPESAVSILPSKPETMDLGGTLSGRVLLANNWTGVNGKDDITGQDYNLINPAESSTYWDHKSPVAQNLPYLSNSTLSELKSNDPIEELCNSTTLWRLENVRIGNLYEDDGSTRVETMNYLSTIGDATNAAHLAMRNMEKSQIISPIYTNGIGTVYFDAVNSITSTNGVGYKLVVEVCTNQLGDVNATPEWNRVKLSVMKKDGDNFTSPVETNELALAISNGGTAENFYRVFAKVNHYGPISFRIRRTEIVENVNSNDAGYILVDNIIASYPTMRADLDTYGTFKLQNRGKATVGVSGAFNVKFPSIHDDIVARAKISYRSFGKYKSSDISQYVYSTKIYYRWRYLNQNLDRWRSIELDRDNGLIAKEPFNYPKGVPGDIEYYYVSFMNAPYYEYVDYSGLGLSVGGFYNEYVPSVTNRFNSANLIFKLESHGEDWFIRLRDGKSDYEKMELVVNETKKTYDKTTNITDRITMELVDDGVWRGIYKTLTNNVEGIKYRIEAFNKQEPGVEDWAINTNMWKVAEEWNTLPVRDIMTDAATTNDWSKIPSDGVGGYLLFQFDEDTKAITIVRADYQNFNAWNDANKGGELFVGNSVEHGEKSGTSPLATSSATSFATWKTMTKDHPDGLWEEDIKTTTGQDYELYVPFGDNDASVSSPNGWPMSNGKVIYAAYKYKNPRINSIEYALQMQGEGRGSIELLPKDPKDSQQANSDKNMPRGIDTIEFYARLAQEVHINDAAIYYGNVAETMIASNYTVVVAGAFDSHSNLTFRGNASLSLFAYYTPSLGGYELRVEQVKASEKELPGSGLYSTNDEPSRNGQQLSLYRWAVDRYTGIVKATLIGTPVMNDAKDDILWPQCDGERRYQPIYFSVSNGVDGVHLNAGFLNDPSFQEVDSSGSIDSLGVTSNWNIQDIDGKKFKNISFLDKDEQRFTKGMYGLLTANSEGLFANPKFISEPVSITGNTVSFMGEAKSRSVNEGGWLSFSYNRMDANPEIGGYRALTPDNQTIDIYVTPRDNDRQDWQLLGRANVRTFGEAYTKDPTYVRFNVCTNENLRIKIVAGRATSDIVIDGIKVTQFSGADWDDANGYADDWVIDNANGGYKNFIFTKSWIRDGAVMLSARRTTPDQPSSIRAPLYDGYNGRGVGLGMFSFNYKNAHPDVNILLQVATNITQSSMSGIDLRNDAWTTVTNFNFNGLSEEDLKSGTKSYYLGLHGVSGLMRIVMDTNVVVKCQNEMDESKFPEIYITEVFTRDEPTLDERAWWGWNLRTVGDDTDSEGRMYLYDLTTDLGQKGMSLALNNSIINNIDTNDTATIKAQQPFLQTPVFATNVVGQVEFKARQYDINNPEAAQITLYGSKTGASSAEGWEPIKTFIFSETTYSTNFVYKTEPGKEYKAFRLSVAGVKGVNSSMGYAPGHLELSPARVLIDEVIVSEAIRASLAFRGVGAFRTKLDTTDFVPNVPSAGEQPLASEAFGIQCEIFAAQLGGEIDFERTPIVKLHWFDGEEPWGYENWGTNKAAKSAYLREATNTNLIYRSSYKLTPEAVIEYPSSALKTIQYELEVVFYIKGSDLPQTNYLSKAGNWFNPSWYKNVDKNAGKESFSAYTILDTVAPGWAWINEANVLGGYDNNLKNKDEAYQYVEIAAPADAKLTGWSVRMIEKLSDTKLVTNTVAIFGQNDLEALKRNLKNMDENNMVYHVIGSPKSLSAGNLKYEDGTLDGVWEFKNSGDVMNTVTGVILPLYPVGVQLVRRSGIVEHEVGFTGENLFDPGDIYYDEYHASNFVNSVNKLIGSQFIYIGDDDYVGANDSDDRYSLSVLSKRGESPTNWFNNVSVTPGKRNLGQVIEGLPPTPNGSSILIYANLDALIGHIRQSFGDVEDSPSAMTLVVPKGLPNGTNITYKVDKWYEMDRVLTNNIATAWRSLGKDSNGASIYEATVAVNASNNVTVVAGAKLNDKLTKDYGLGPDNKYRDAVIDWLEKGTNIKGDAWENPGSEDISLAEYQSLSGNFVTNLTLTQMYWLDIDPTASNFVFRGGMVKAPTPITRSVALGDEANDYLEVDSTNYQMGIKLYITNKTDNANSKYYNKAWAPYVLRGRGKGESSIGYENATQPWSNVTFKVTAFLNNGQDSHMTNKERWLPLRWFVFNENSFNDDFTTYVEIRDPFSKNSPAYSEGWYDWHQSHPNDGLFFSWSLDTRLRQFPVEVLKEVNYYDYQ